MNGSDAWLSFWDMLNSRHVTRSKSHKECVVLAWWLHQLTLKLADEYPEDGNMQ